MFRYKQIKFIKIKLKNIYLFEETKNSFYKFVNKGVRGK